MDAAVIDLDGTVYISSAPVPGAVEGIRQLREAGLDLVFVTNTSSKSRDTCLERLRRLGVQCQREEIISSASVAAEIVADNHSDDDVYVIGMEALREELLNAGLTITDTPEEADVLVVGKDRSFTFDSINRALDVLGHGAPFVATNRDRASPTGDGLEAGTGAIIQAIAFASDREPDVIAGKPHDPMIDATLDFLDCPPSRCVMIGDNPETDLIMGRRAGMMTVLQPSGLGGGQPEAVDAADHVVDSLEEILDILERPDAR